LTPACSLLHSPTLPQASSGLTNATYDATIPAQRSRDNTKFNEGAAAGRQYRSMSFLERAGYSIYTSIVIEAPISHVWRVATDIEALPERITSLVSAERIEDDRVDRAVVGGKPNPARRASFAIDDDVHIDYDAMEALIHSRWKMTKLDPILQKPLHFITTFTQISVTKEKRSVSGSVSSIGGVTSTVKRTIEPIDNGSGQEACRLTALVSVVPNQYFILGLPFCCFTGFFKRRTQKTFEADNADFKLYCEDKARLCEASSG